MLQTQAMLLTARTVPATPLRIPPIPRILLKMHPEMPAKILLMSLTAIKSSVF